MPRPVCLKCQREMELIHTGGVVQFNALVANGAYEQWSSDSARCPGCGAEVVFRYAETPSWQRHRDPATDLRTPLVVVEERPFSRRGS